MSRGYVFIIGGEYGSGKTLTEVSYVPRRHPVGEPVNRLVIDMEYRADGYQSSNFGEKGDKPEKLLYEYDLMQPTLDGFAALSKEVVSGKCKQHVIIFDNAAIFQEHLTGWCADKATCVKLLEIFGQANRFKLFLDYNFKQDAQWWLIVKTIIREFLAASIRNGISVIVGTQMKNVWENYGVKGKDANGNPLQKIKGKTIKLLEPWIQMAETSWNLTRMGADGKLMTAPMIELDRFAPKNSLVGLPPKFKFTTWERLWQLAEARGVTTEAEIRELEPAKVEYAPEDDELPTSETKAEAKSEPSKTSTGFFAEVAAIDPRFKANGGINIKAMKEVLVAAGKPFDKYDVAKHDDWIAALKASLAPLTTAPSAN